MKSRREVRGGGEEERGVRGGAEEGEKSEGRRERKSVHRSA